MQRAMLLLIMLATMLGMRAQTDDEYLMEVGGGLGIMGWATIITYLREIFSL